MSEDSSRLPVACSVKASLDNSSMYVFRGPRGSLEDSANIGSIVTASMCFVHLKTGVGKVNVWKYLSVIGDFNGLIKEVFEAQEFFVFFRVSSKLVTAHAQFNCEAGQVGLITTFCRFNQRGHGIARQTFASKRMVNRRPKVSLALFHSSE